MCILSRISARLIFASWGKNERIGTGEMIPYSALTTNNNNVNEAGILEKLLCLLYTIIEVFFLPHKGPFCFGFFTKLTITIFRRDIQDIAISRCLKIS